jgi:hypothetical protein
MPLPQNTIERIDAERHSADLWTNYRSIPCRVVISANTSRNSERSPVVIKSNDDVVSSQGRSVKAVKSKCFRASETGSETENSVSNT